MCIGKLQLPIPILESRNDGNGSTYLPSSANDGPATDGYDAANGHATSDNQSATATRSFWESVIH